MEILENYDLKNLNTFGVPARAKYFTEVKTEEDLKKLFQEIKFKENPKLFLGGGSNILFTQDFYGIVVLNKLKGIEIIEESGESVLIKSAGGEVWHDLVEFAVGRGYWGIENLSSIPGTVGAAPVQNIGAYGAEIKESLYQVEAYDVETGEKRVFTNDMYAHGYRESIFKNELKGKYFISAVILKLSKIPKHNLGYKSLKDYLEKNKVEVSGPRDISEAVREIRKEKLPDPRIIANAGSFFKNSFVEEKKLEELLKEYPSMPFFRTDAGIKVPSGWLIEQSGWKGKKIGDAGVYDKHALVLVNHGGATGVDIKNLAEGIIESVYKKFGIKLAPEVNFI